MVRHRKGYDTRAASVMCTAGKKAEVAFDNEDPREVWFPATVLNFDHGKFQVEYQQPGSGDEAVFHKATVDFWHIRPSPPHLSYTHFSLDDEVDAYYDYGWWRGVITKELADNKYNVFFEHTKKEREFICPKVRPHLEWKRGEWYNERCKIDLFERTAFSVCTAGKKVEVTFDDKDPHEVWFPATVLKHSHKGTFQVEYQQPGSGDEAVLHKATVDMWQIRPSPPHPRDKDFALDDEVDAYYDYGWWCGVITQELPGNRYSVFFEHSNKERKFICSKLRPHLEWEDGKWHNEGETIFQGNIACDLHTKQIEPTTPNTGTRSTGATSIMKPAEQTIVDSYDDNSPPSKKMKNETVLDDSTKKPNGTSAGHSEGLDFEFGKTENLSHGKKVRSTRGKAIEQEPPAMDSSKEKRKAANTNTSSNLDEGAKDDSGKTKTQESVEKDATKDTAGLQYNEITVSQEKIIKKFSGEIVSVTDGVTEQLDAPSEQLTVVDKEVHEDIASVVASKRKRRRPLRLQAKSPEILLTASHENKGVDPSAASVVESAQVKEVSSPTSSGTKSLEKDQEPLKQEKLLNESEERDLKANRSRKKYSSVRGKRGQRRIICIDTKAPVQDASKEKADENMETRKTDASAGKLLDIVSVDQPLSTWIDGMPSPIPIHSPGLFQYKLQKSDTLCNRSTIEDCLETLVELESNGFNVEVIRDCLTRLLLLKDKKEELEDRSKGVVEKLEEQKIQEKTIDDEVDVIDRQIRQLEETRRKVLLKKEEWNLEVDAMKATEEAIEQKIMEVAAEFDGLAAAPL
nr:hypothetical protein [Tanacetum cinerariifolium]